MYSDMYLLMGLNDIRLGIKRNIEVTETVDLLLRDKDVVLDAPLLNLK